MRVIAGSAGGIQLEVPRRGVRPTMDRVKAAIFSSLADKVIDARVLDLFAGSGGLGIEALSRGAASVMLVDRDRQAIDVITRNLRKVKLEATTRQQDVFEFLKRQSESERTRSLGGFDLIFADPPYEQMESGEFYTDKLLKDEILPKLLVPGGIFILEKRPGETVPEFAGWQLIRQKSYGATEVLFLSSWHRRPADNLPAEDVSSTPGPSASGRGHEDDPHTES
jgi:16S rRNA (guanine966-N2)-methyltransferase